MRKRILSLALVALAAVSCETDVDINAEWKDITAVFGLLDVDEPVQYIKINKVFLGDGSALEYALEPDSIYYDESQISARILELDQNEQLQHTITLNRVDTVLKDEGIFAGPNQFLYATDATLNPDFIYRLEIQKNDESPVVSSETQVVEPMNMIFPVTNGLINPAAKTVSMRFSLGETVRSYQVGVRLNVVEEDTALNTLTPVTVEFLLPKEDGELGEGETYYKEFKGAAFMQYVAVTLGEPANNVIRHAVDMDLAFYLAGDDFETYLEINGPSDGIVQERPQFSNIENGIGLFASRFIGLGSEDLELRSAFYDSLTCSEYTRDLAFAKYVTNAGTNGTDTIVRCTQ